ncbi:MAG: hypothetical protein DME22_00845, partial [Verrucomicrobia bacterium]
VYEDVLGNLVDLGLVAFPNKDTKLEIVPLRRDNMVLICHPQHPLAKYKTTKLSAIIGQKFIAFEPDIPTRKAIDRVLKDHNVTVQPVMEFDNIETVKRAVEIDAGVAIVPQGTIMQEVAKQTLAAVQFEDAQFFRQLAAIYSCPSSCGRGPSLFRMMMRAQVFQRNKASSFPVGRSFSAFSKQVIASRKSS